MRITEEEKQLFIAGVKRYEDENGDKRIATSLKRLARLNEAVEQIHYTPIDQSDVNNEPSTIPCVKAGKRTARYVSLEELLVHEYRHVAKYVPKVLTEEDAQVSQYFQDLGHAINACLKNKISIFVDNREEIDDEADYTVSYEDIEIDDINSNDRYELYNRLIMFKLLCGLKIVYNYINSRSIDELYEHMHTKVVSNNITKDLNSFVKTKK